MSTFSDLAKEIMLDALPADRLRLHSGDPGVSGSLNQVGTLTLCTFGAAIAGSRKLSAPCNFTGLGASQAVTWFSAWSWNSGTPLFLGKGQIPVVGNDLAANAAGEYTLTTDTDLQQLDPA